MTVAEVLIFAESIGLGGVVAIARADDGGVVVEEEADIALEMNGGGEVFAGREIDRAAAGVVTFLDGEIDGGRVIGETVGGGAEVQDIIDIGGERGLGEMGRREGIGGFGGAGGNSGGSEEQFEG